MSEKTAELYTLVLKRILEVLDNKFPGEQCAVRLMISDFELAILSSMKETFPNGRARGCWFHFAQVWAKNISHLKRSLLLTARYSYCIQIFTGYL